MNRRSVLIAVVVGVVVLACMGFVVWTASYVLSEGPHVVQVLRSDSGKLVFETRHRAFFAKTYIESAAFSPDGRLVASADMSGRILLAGVPDGRVSRVLNGRGGGHQLLRFSPCGQLLAQSAMDHIQVWRIGGGRKDGSPKFDLPRGLRPFVFWPDGKLLLSDQLSVTGGEHIRSLSAPSDSISGLAVSLDGRLIATASASGVVIWRSSDGKPLRALNCPDAPVVEFSPDGSMLAVNGSTSGAAVYRVSDGRLFRRFRGDWFVAFSGDGRMLATVEGISVLVWSVADGTLVCRVPASTTNGVILGIAFLPRDRLVVNVIDSVATSPGNDHAVRVFSFGGGKATKVYSLDHHVLLAVSPDGSLLAVGDRPYHP